MQRNYLAVIEKGADGFGVFFPDLPGCTSWGATLTEAANNAVVAAQAHTALLAEEGEAVPHPSEVEQIVVDKDVDEAARLLVPVQVADEKVRVNITLPESVLALLDAMAHMRELDRSALIARLTREAAYSAPGCNVVTAGALAVSEQPWMRRLKHGYGDPLTYSVQKGLIPHSSGGSLPDFQGANFENLTPLHIKIRPGT